MRILALARYILLFGGTVAAPIAAHAEVLQGEIDLLEVHLGNGKDHLVLDSTFTVGAGSNQFAIKVEGGSYTRTAFDDFEIQALFSRNLTDSVAISVGLRHDFREGSDLTHGLLAIQAELTPWLEGEHFAYLSQHGDLTGGGQLTASWKISPRLTLEPRVSVGWAGQDIPDEELAGGFTDFEGSARLRHAVGENLNVYIGVIHERLLGRTRDYAVTSGQSSKVTRAVIGAGLNF